VTTPKQTNRQRVATLSRRVLELEAQLAHASHFARIGLVQAGRDRTMGSAVIVQMHYLGGKEVCPPFALKDGLSPETIAALLSDLRYTYERAVEFKP